MYTYVQELYIYQYWFVVNWSPLQNINVDIFLVYVEHKRNNLWYLWMEFAGRYVNRRMTSTCFPWMPTLKSQTQIPWLNSSNKTGTESYRHDCMLSLVSKIKAMFANILKAYIAGLVISVDYTWNTQYIVRAMVVPFLFTFILDT